MPIGERIARKVEVGLAGAKGGGVEGVGRGGQRGRDNSTAATELAWAYRLRILNN